MFGLNENKQQGWGSNFLKDLESSDAMIRKEASDNFDEWLHTYQRQNGVWRKVLPTVAVTKEDFAESLEDRDPFVIRPIIPKSLGAFSVNFDTGTATHTMYAEKYAIYLQRIMTPKYRIDKIYLTAYKGDLTVIFKDLMLQDVLETEDILGITQLNAVCGNKSEVNEEVGIKQYIDGGLEINTKSVMHGVKGLTLGTNNINPAQGLVHRSFWWDLIATFSADQQGDRITEDVMLGKTGVLEESLAGISWKTVLDRQLIPMGTMYVMAEPKYCGEFITYEDATIFTKVDDAIWYEMFAHETIGMQFANRAAAVRVDYGIAEAESWLSDGVHGSIESPKEEEGEL
jgi:hypothetical protein